MEREEIVRMFQAINRNVSCPRCGARYGFENIKIVNFEDNFCFVSLRCGNHPPVLASIAVYNSRSDSAKKTDAISSDEVIKTYIELQKIKSIKKLLYRRDPRR
jgi:hypothetical protein